MGMAEPIPEPTPLVIKPRVPPEGKVYSNWEGRVLDVTCKCGKVLKNFDGWNGHMRMKHPTEREQEFASGHAAYLKEAFKRNVGYGELLDEVK
jgi:hypothetical protein